VFEDRVDECLELCNSFSAICMQSAALQVTAHNPRLGNKKVQRSERNIDIIWAVVVGKLRQGALALSPDSSGASHVQIIIIMTRQRLS